MASDARLPRPQLNLFQPGQQSRTQPLPSRPVHYLGSKLRMLEELQTALLSVADPGARVCDLFAGSGVVSATLARNWKVTSVDIQEYSRVLCAAMLTGPGGATSTATVAQALESTLARAAFEAVGPLMQLEEERASAAAGGDHESLAELLDHSSMRAMIEADPDTVVPEIADAVDAVRERLGELDYGFVVTRHFGGLYFSWRQALELDLLLCHGRTLPPRERDFTVAATLAAASDVVNTVGKQFAQPIKLRTSTGQIKRHLVSQVLRDRSMRTPESFQEAFARLARSSAQSTGHRAIRADFRDFLASDEEISLVYADPPYTRDHYSRFYHVLETMARGDEPDVSRTKIRAGDSDRLSTGLYRDDRHQSPFSIKSQAPKAFEQLFRAVASRRVPLVLSYSTWSEANGNRPRMVSQEALVDLASAEFGDVDVQSVSGLRHNKFNRNDRNVEVKGDAELLLVCRP